MSELLHAEQPLSEVLNPRNTPEMGFQSYEMLGGNGEYRDAQKSAFLAGEIVNPTLDYPKLDTTKLNHGIGTLDDILVLADKQTDEQVRATVWDSAAYRMAEMHWLRSSGDLLNSYQGLGEQALDTKVAQIQELNEQLYGTPEQAIFDSTLSEVWAQIDTKELTGDAVSIKNELEKGFVTEAGSEHIYVAPLRRSDTERLPQIPAELLSALKEKFYADNPDVVDFVHKYHELIVKARPVARQEFTPTDMYNIFSAVHKMRDPEGQSGVTIVFDPDATALSWETPLMAVKIGGKRVTDLVKSPEKMLSKVAHEYVVHGGRCIHGSRSAVPVLGTGIFSEAESNESSDYLTFEEGLAGTIEAAIASNDFVWQPKTIEKTLALGLAYEGKDFRQVYETLWRVRALMNSKDGSISDSSIKKAQSAAYASTVRIFRGTPTDMPRINEHGQPRVLTFNKDLAYLKGKLQMIEFWDQYKNDPEMIDLIFKAKFDPLNKRQLHIVRSTFAQSTH